MRNPVLLVHGYMDTPLTPWWNIVEKRLSNAGYESESIKRLNLSGSKIPGKTIHSPRLYAKNLKNFVDSEFSGMKFDIIGHSMGGLVSRWFIEKLNGFENVNKLITIGTPHYGTEITKLGSFTPGGRDMIPGSDFLEELNSGDLAEGVEYYSVWSKGDYAILPSYRAKLEGAKNINPGFYPHVMLVWSGDVFRRAVLPALNE